MDEIYQRKELAYRCLIDAARSLSGAADIDELVGQILSSSRDVMQCWACSISLPDPENGDLVIRGTQAELKGQVLRGPLGKGIADGYTEHDFAKTRQTRKLTPII